MARRGSLDLIADVVLALRSLELSSPTDPVDTNDDDETTVPATTLYAPWAKVQAWLPSWAPLLPLPRPENLLLSSAANASTEDPWRVPLRARLWVKGGGATPVASSSNSGWGVLGRGAEGRVVVGAGEEAAEGMWVVEPVGGGSDAFRYVLSR